MEADRNKKLLVVDDDPAQLKLLQRLLSKGEHEVLTATNGKEALRIVLTDEPRIVLTDLVMPEMTGQELCRALRQHEGVRFVYIIAASARSRKDCIISAFDAGADDFVSKPIQADELLARIRAADRIVGAESALAKRTREVHRINAEMAMAHQKLNLANDKLTRMATTDELTGLLNRREGFAKLAEFINASSRYGYELSCVMLDIDHFKRFNDTHGHAAGDYVLRETARVLRTSTRATDRVCRVGGEEFLVICQGVGGEGAHACAENLRASVEAATYTYEGAKLSVTISLGGAVWRDGISTPDELIRLADDALYISKRNGRNRVTMDGDPVPAAPDADIAGNKSTAGVPASHTPANL
ncbi:MAG: diguanylate cyclase [Phycisphaerales bacterium]|nr:diguanylate cyclase [Phycisphaerales bacterium]MCB9857122.1 diguanylate cyclase [Phycisphaerales bacterium]MCB9861751.1 diguanylate cyclase [Phycisphaerales bacterium]